MTRIKNYPGESVRRSNILHDLGLRIEDLNQVKEALGIESKPQTEVKKISVKNSIANIYRVKELINSYDYAAATQVIKLTGFYPERKTDINNIIQLMEEFAY